MSVYYSKNHKELFFIDNGMEELVIHGNGIILSEDTVTWGADESWKELFKTVTVCDRITEIHSGVLEQFPNMKKLNLPKSIVRIDMTDSLKTFLQSNDVLIHAAYGSYGDAFAQDCGLRFLPNNIELGWYRDEEHDESTQLILRFHAEGTMDILIEIFTTGISAGSSGGASLDRPMPKEYYPGCTLEEFADMFPARYHTQIMDNPEVKEFLRRDALHDKHLKCIQKEEEK